MKGKLTVRRRKVSLLYFAGSEPKPALLTRIFI